MVGWQSNFGEDVTASRTLTLRGKPLALALALGTCAQRESEREGLADTMMLGRVQRWLRGRARGREGARAMTPSYDTLLPHRMGQSLGL